MEQGILVALCVVLEVDLVNTSVYKGTHLHSGPQSSESSSAESISREMSKESEITHQPFKHYLVLDFESTCQEGDRIDPQEIIEFPCLLVKADDFSLVDQVAMV